MGSCATSCRGMVAGRMSSTGSGAGRCAVADDGALTAFGVVFDVDGQAREVAVEVPPGLLADAVRGDALRGLSVADPRAALERAVEALTLHIVCHPDDEAALLAELERQQPPGIVRLSSSPAVERGRAVTWRGSLLPDVPRRLS